LVSKNNEVDKLADTRRRDFLRKSVYAVYATPLITALLVEEANAAPSCTGGIKKMCSKPKNFCKKRCLETCGTICLD
jgi:hypothetical protein